MNRPTHPHDRSRRAPALHVRAAGVALARILVVALASVLAASVAWAHGPDPMLGGKLWAQDQVVPYAWKAGQAPPAWMAVPIDAAAGDVGATKASRAASFARTTASAASLIAYGEPTGCSAAGIACFDRSGAPASFRMWFRAHGHMFDWGTLRWCQGLTTIANGCFDAETIALDEFGHVEILNHHVNLADGTDYEDAVVQTVSHARPDDGWDAHALAPCDTARLQLEYDRPDWSSDFSTCLGIPTAATIAASATSIYTGTSVRLTATLRTTTATSNRALANDPISDRVVQVQRRTVGTTGWSTVGTMAPSATTEGSYAITISPTATYEWRATFSTTTEGLVGSSSSIVRITVSGCTGSGCPSRPLP